MGDPLGIALSLVIVVIAAAGVVWWVRWLERR